MKSLLLAVLVSFSFVSYASASNSSQDVVSAKKGKSEPAPKDSDERKGGDEEVDPRQGTYEGNDRDGGSFDGGGYEGDGGGGMIGEIFYIHGNPYLPVTTTSTKEDRGDVIVYTIITRQAVGPTQMCTTTTVTTVEKATEKVLSSNTDTYCLHF